MFEAREDEENEEEDHGTVGYDQQSPAEPEPECSIDPSLQTSEE